MKRRFALGVILLAASVFIYGCASYGILRPIKAEDVTIETLAKNWTNYTVYWTGIDIGEPTGIMFDSKADDKALTGDGDRWYKVESEESLSKMVGWMKFNQLYYPFLWAMVGSYLQLGETDLAYRLMFESLGRDSRAWVHEWDLSKAWSEEGGDLRRHPRFGELAERIGLLDYWKQYGFPDGCRAGLDTAVVCN